MNRLGRLALYFGVYASVLSANAFAENGNPVQYYIFEIIGMIGRLSWDKPEPYYGSGIQFAWDNQKSTYFVADFHTLPRDQKNWDRLSLTVSDEIKIGQPVTLRVKVAGYWPDYDIAILEAKHQAVAGGVITIAAKQNYLDGHFIHEDIAEKNWRVAVVGTADAEAKPLPSLTRYLWGEEAKFLTLHEDTDIQPKTNEEAIKAWRASDSVMRIERSKDCQPSVFEYCYRVPLKTLGYSGGAFLVAPPSNAHAVKIAGMVWGYSPLARDTIILPWNLVKERASKLLQQYLANGKKETVVINGSVDKKFTYRSSTEIEIRKNDKEVFIAKSGKFGSLAMFGGGESSGGGGESSGGGGESSGGGGESSGGGGESSGGGGESSGGGGESSGGGGETLLRSFRDELGNTATLVSHAALKAEIEKPENWFRKSPNVSMLVSGIIHFRGVSALLSYMPGIEINGVHYFRYDEKPIVNLSSFVHAYRENPEGVLEKEPKALEFPKKILSQSGNDFSRYGLFTQASAHRLKLPLPQGLRMYPHEAEAITLATAEKSQLMLYRSDVHAAGCAISSGSITITDDNFIIELDAPRFQTKGSSGKIKYVSEGPLKTVGDYYLRYEGKLNHTTAIPYVKSTSRGKDVGVHGVVSLQYSPTDKRYELKLFAMGLLPPEWDEYDNLWPDNPKAEAFSILFEKPDAVMMQSVYLPLYSVPK